MLYYEDFPVGGKKEFPERLISREEIIGFAEEYDPQTSHTAEGADEETAHKKLVASGWHMACSLARMVFKDPPEPTAFLGSPGVEEVLWHQPVRPGDRLRATSEITEARASKSKPGMGLTKTHYEVFNQDNVMVMTMVIWGMIARSPQTLEAS